MTTPLHAFADRLRSLLQQLAPHASHWQTCFPSLATELFSLQFEHVEPYRRLCHHQGRSPATVADWTDIPAVPSAAFKEFDLTSLPLPERVRVFHSSGTTTHAPSRHYHSADSLALYEASLTPTFAVHLLAGLDQPPRFLCLTPPPELTPHSSLAHMFRAVQLRFAPQSPSFLADLDPTGAWRLQLPAALDALHQAARQTQPVLLLGTAFSYVHLLDALAQSGSRLQLPPGSRALETGGYKGRSRSLPRAELHRALATQLGLDPALIVSEFGMSELGSQAYDTTAGAQPTPPAPRRFRFPGWARARVISPDHGREVSDGRPGLLQIVDLVNVWSVQAIQTGDLAIRHGDGFELLGRVPALEPRGCSLLPAAIPAPATPLRSHP